MCNYNDTSSAYSNGGPWQQHYNNPMAAYYNPRQYCAGMGSSRGAQNNALARSQVVTDHLNAMPSPMQRRWNEAQKYAADVRSRKQFMQVKKV